MKRVILILAGVLMALMPMRADSYREMLKQYLTYSGDVNSEQMADQLSQAIVTMLPDAEKADFTKAMNEYATQQMWDDMTDIFLPSFKNHVSEADLRAAIKQYDDERFVRLKAKSMELVSNLEKDPNYQQFMGSFQNALMAIMSGQTAQDVAVPASIDATYTQAFARFYRKTGLSDMMSSTYSSYIEMIAKSLASENVPNAQEIAGSISSYMTRNMETLMLTIFHSAYTTDDMNYMAEMMDTDFGHHCMSAVKELTSNPMALATELIGKMQTWMNSRYPKYGDTLTEILKLFKTMQ